MREQSPLLTIAIPTWNRALQLKAALDFISPKIQKYASLVEIVISDNHSDDDTQEVVKNYVEAHSTINIISHRQETNTGFYGNFRKCYSLSKGKYFWLLSDDDYVLDGVIDMVMDILQKEEEVGAVFLNDWTFEVGDISTLSFEYKKKNIFFEEGHYRHTLISSIIHINAVGGNDEIFDQLDKNRLIGYAVFLKATACHEKFAVIYGNSLAISNDKNIRFDALNTFTVDLSYCLNIAYKYLPARTVDLVANQFLATLISTHFRDWKYNNRYRTKENVLVDIFYYYIKYRNFWLYIVPVSLLPQRQFLRVKEGIKRIFKRN